MIFVEKLPNVLDKLSNVILFRKFFSLFSWRFARRTAVAVHIKLEENSIPAVARPNKLDVVDRRTENTDRNIIYTVADIRPPYAATTKPFTALPIAAPREEREAITPTNKAAFLV